MERDIKEQDYIDIVPCLTFEAVPAEENVFEYGNPSTLSITIVTKVLMVTSSISYCKGV